MKLMTLEDLVMTYLLLQSLKHPKNTDQLCQELGFPLQLPVHDASTSWNIL